MPRVSAEDNEKLRGIHLARCRIDRGSERDEVLRLLADHGVTEGEARAYIEPLYAARHRRFRLKGVLNLLLGTGALGIFAWVMMSQSVFYGLRQTTRGSRFTGIEVLIVGAVFLALGLTRLLLGGRSERSHGGW